MKITEIYTVVKYVEYEGEILINLQELEHLLKADFRIELEECLIVPYYIQNNKRMELYQYEFCCTDEISFEEYVLKLTGKEKEEDISKEFLYLRKNCFSTCNEVKGLSDYLKFLFRNGTLKTEIKQVFDNYNEENLYAVVY